MGAHSLVRRHGVTIFGSRAHGWTSSGPPFLYAWTVLCLGLIVAKLALFLALPWVLVLVPIWLPTLACVCLLVGAMYLDSLHK
jgi:hypothetical protein